MTKDNPIRATNNAAETHWFKRALPLLILVCLIAAAFMFDVHKLLSFQSLKDNRDVLQDFVLENQVLAIFIFIVLYTAVVALSLPGAAVLSISSGFLFGTILGTSLAVTAATLGATLVFLIAKSALGNVLKAKAGPFLSKMQDGFQENAFSYLLSLRLVPLFPFFIINLVPAFLNVKIRDFVLATVIGIIPGAFVYVSVGTGIGSVFDSGESFSLKSVITPEILIALTGLGLLSLLPVILKKMKKAP